MSGAADARHLTEGARRDFQTERAARSYARRRVTVGGGTCPPRDWHTAYVFGGRPTRPLDELVVEYSSAARRRFEAAVAVGESV
jgi:hypothetical protein